MGGCGSKTADKADRQQQPPKAEVMSTGKEEQILSKPNGSFKINLEKAYETENLGISLALLDEATLRVKAVKEAGTVVTYNSLKATTPDVQLREGDYIVNVNGLSGHKDKMLEEIKNNSKLVLTVQRDSTASAVQEIIAIDTTAQLTEAEKVASSPERDPKDVTPTKSAGTDLECKAADKVAEAPVALEPAKELSVDKAVVMAITEEATTSAVVETVEGEGNVDDTGCQGCGGWFQ